MRLEPGNGAPQCILNRSGLVSQFALSLGRGSKHFLSAHANGIYGCSRFFPHNRSGEELIKDGKTECYGMRDFRSWRRQPSERSKLIENLLECEIFATQDVRLSGHSFLHCEKMSARHVFHVHYVQPRINVRGKFAL